MDGNPLCSFGVSVPEKELSEALPSFLSLLIVGPSRSGGRRRGRKLCFSWLNTQVHHPPSPKSRIEEVENELNLALAASSWNNRFFFFGIQSTKGGGGGICGHDIVRVAQDFKDFRAKSGRNNNIVCRASRQPVPSVQCKGPFKSKGGGEAGYSALGWPSLSLSFCLAAADLMNISRKTLFFSQVRTPFFFNKIARTITRHSEAKFTLEVLDLLRERSREGDRVALSSSG